MVGLVALVALACGCQASGPPDAGYDCYLAGTCPEVPYTPPKATPPDTASEERFGSWVYLRSGDDPACVPADPHLAARSANVALRWSRPVALYGGARNIGLVLADHRVFTDGANIDGIDLDTGRITSANSSAVLGDYDNGLCAGGGSLYTVRGADILALDPTTITLVVRRKLPPPAGADPRSYSPECPTALPDGRISVAQGRDLVMFRPDGDVYQRVWRLPGLGGLPAFYDATHDVLLIDKGTDSGTVAVSAQNGHVLWQSPGTRPALVVGADRWLSVTTTWGSGDMLSLHDLASGKLLDQHHFPFSRADGAPLVAASPSGNRIYYLLDRSVDYHEQMIVYGFDGQLRPLWQWTPSAGEAADPYAWAAAVPQADETGVYLTVEGCRVYHVDRAGHLAWWARTPYPFGQDDLFPDAARTVLRDGTFYVMGADTVPNPGFFSYDPWLGFVQAYAPMSPGGTPDGGTPDGG